MLPKAGFDGLTQITLTPMELLDRPVKFIPPPLRHLHRQRARIWRSGCAKAWAENASAACRLRFPRCGTSLRLIAFIVERAVIVRILQHLGNPPSRRGPGRAGARQRPRQRGPSARMTAMLLHSNPTPSLCPAENQRQDVAGQETGQAGAALSAPARPDARERPNRATGRVCRRRGERYRPFATPKTRPESVLGHGAWCAPGRQWM